MASERDAVRRSVAEKEHSDGELQATLANAAQLQHGLDKDKEANRHREAKYDKLVSMAPVIVAAIVVVLGFGVFFWSMSQSAQDIAHAEFWAKQGERGIGIATAALAYIFGKGSN